MAKKQGSKAPVLRQATTAEIEAAAAFAQVVIPSSEPPAPDGEARISGYLVTAVLPTPLGPDEPRFTLLDVVDQRYSEADVARLRTMKPFEVPRLVGDVPAELQALAPDAPIRAREFGVDRLTTAGELLARVREVSARQRLGLFTEDEAAALFAQAIAGRRGLIEADVHEDHHRAIRDAVDAGQLRVQHPTAGTIADPADWPGPSRAWLLIDRSDLEAWLNKQPGALRLPQEESKEGAGTAPEKGRGTAKARTSPAPSPQRGGKEPALTDAQQAEVRRLYATVPGHSHRGLAARFGVTHKTMGKYLKGVKKYDSKTPQLDSRNRPDPLLSPLKR